MLTLYRITPTGRHFAPPTALHYVHVRETKQHGGKTWTTIQDEEQYSLKRYFLTLELFYGCHWQATCHM